MLDILVRLAAGVGTTVELTAVAFAIGAVLGLPLALMRRGDWLPLRLAAVVVVEVIRAVPPLVWLFIVYYSVGSGAIQLSTFEAAVIGLGLISAAHLSEIYRAGLESVAPGQWEAARALSLPTLLMYRKVVLPQAVALVVPPAATFAIGLLKDSAVASVIGAQDITFLAVQETQQTLNGLGNFAIAGLLYIALSVPVAIVARYAAHSLSRQTVS